MQPISIVIPVYNRAHLVTRTLESVLAQSYRPLQLVLVDNDRADGTCAVLQQFAADYSAPDFEVSVVSETRRTAGAARNRGAQYATGDWLLFFDSDDVMHPDLVQNYVNVIDKARGDVDIVSIQSTLYYEDGSKRVLPFYKIDTIGVHLLHGQFATQRYIMRKEFFFQCNGWNVDLPVWEDWELGIRMLLAGARVAFLSKDLVSVYHTSDSITGDSFAGKVGQWENAMNIGEATITSSQHPDVQRFRRLLDFKRITLAAHYEAEGRSDLSTPLRDEAMLSLQLSYGNSAWWRLFVKPVVNWLYRRISRGARGSAVIARIVL